VKFSWAKFIGRKIKGQNFVGQKITQ